MTTREARELGHLPTTLVTQGEAEAAYAQLLPVLQLRAPFRLLDVIDQTRTRALEGFA